MQKALLGIQRNICLRPRNFELDIKFKEGATPIFRKPRTEPFAILDDMNDALEDGVRKGVWKLTDFNDWGTPIVPIKKDLQIQSLH